MSDSWLEYEHPCLVFVEVHIQRESEENADDDQDPESDDSDRQDIQVEDSLEESEYESE